MVFPAKYQKVVFDAGVDRALADSFQEIEKRYPIKFLKVGGEDDQIRMLVQSVPKYSVTTIVTRIKSLIAREVFRKCTNVKKALWSGEFWSDGYFSSTVGKHGSETTIRNYVKDQGQEYILIHSDHQLTLF